MALHEAFEPLRVVLGESFELHGEARRLMAVRIERGRAADDRVARDRARFTGDTEAHPNARTLGQMLIGLEEGQAIDVTIEEQDSGIYVISAVTLTETSGRQAEPGQ